jgi:hypothetical protein
LRNGLVRLRSRRRTAPITSHRYSRRLLARWPCSGMSACGTERTCKPR